jgi:hypothetical protein
MNCSLSSASEALKQKTKDQLAVRTTELLSTVNTALSVTGMAFLTRSLIAVKAMKGLFKH